MPTDDDGELVVVNGLTLDPQRWEASAGGRQLHLTRTEFSLLLFMARQPGRAFSRDELLDSVWGPGYLAGSNVVDQAMTGLRRKLADDPRHPTFIETVTGVGYRLHHPHRRAAPRRRAIAWAGAASLGLVLAGLAVGLGIWFARSEGTGEPAVQQTLRFHASSALTDPGEVSGADCSQDLVVKDAKSVSTLSGEFIGGMEARSTTRLYQGTDCLSGVSESSFTVTDKEGNTLDGISQALVITYRLPDIPDTAVNNQISAVTITAGSGRYAGVRGDGSCTTLSLSTLVGEELDASSESDCDWRLEFPKEPGVAPPPGLTLDLSASPAQLTLFGHEMGVPSQGRFLAIVRNGNDAPLEDAILTLPAPQAAIIQAHASCGAVPDEICLQDEGGAPPRGSRSWRLGDIAPHSEKRFEFTLQLLDAGADIVRVRLELDAQGLAQPLRSRDILIQVVR
ncbi:MAG: winged helix-turn-helix domain-containing protein [Dehalococcoidia bacterium]|nr:winged helix-turn-helix domain-containing protein [Dehalococcoidia bacterium]